MSTNVPPPDDWNRLAEATGAEGVTLARPTVQAARRRHVLPLGLAAAVLVAAVAWHSPLSPWPPGPSQQELRDGQQAALFLAAQAIRDYARGNGRYPDSLDQVLPLRTALEYRPSLDGFELRTISANGAPLVLHSR